MRVSISRSEVKGQVAAPSSKSYTIRGLMCAALAEGESELARPLAADDTEAAWEVLSQMGVGIERQGGSWVVRGGWFHDPNGDLFCHDSAATSRFMTAIASLVPGKVRLTAGPSLSRRPVEPLLAALRQLGVTCSASNGRPPVEVIGGRLQGGTVALPGDISSQYVSALLLVAPLAANEVTIRLTTPLESKPYVEMTIECLAAFGIEVEASPDFRTFSVPRQTYRPTRYEVEGDWSSASYFLALGATSGEVRVTGLNAASLQGDRVLVDILRRMGADVAVERNDVVVRKARLKAVRVDLNDCIDLLPTVAVLAALAEGTSELTGIARARLKESDRVGALREGLVRMGVKVVEEKERLLITGGSLTGAEIDSRADHRMAMAFSVLGTAVGGVTISDAECVAKTYPEFWTALEGIGGKVVRNGQ